MDRRLAPSMTKKSSSKPLKKASKSARDNSWFEELSPENTLMLSGISDSQSSLLSDVDLEIVPSSRHPFSHPIGVSSSSSSSSSTGAGPGAGVGSGLATFPVGNEEDSQGFDPQYNDEQEQDPVADESEEKDEDATENEVEGSIEDNDAWIQQHVSRDLVEIDEIAEIFQVSKSYIDKMKGEEWLYNLLFVLLCCIAGDNIVSSTQRSDLYTFHETLANEIHLLLENIHEKQATFGDHILKYFPEGKFPRAFKEYIAKIADKKPSKDYASNIIKRAAFKTADEETIKHCFFGSHVEDTFKESKSAITKIIGLWVPSHHLKNERNIR